MKKSDLIIIANKKFKSRLIVGTGKYKTMKQCAEAVKISYDETKTTLNERLKIFFKTHDPTTRNRQGNDTGTQYRSVIFYDNKNQLNFLEDYIETLDSSDTYNSKIVTTLEKKTEFFIAEEYHHNYFEKNPFNGYCNVVVRPKVEKFRKEYKA